MALETTSFDDDVYEISPSILDDVPAIWQTGAPERPAEDMPATYLLAADVFCPSCFAAIRSVHVYGLSTPRPAAGARAQERALVVACPKCASTVPAELAGL